MLIKSSQLVHSGEVVKLSKGKAQDVTLFLFDHQLVYCRKVILMEFIYDLSSNVETQNYNTLEITKGQFVHGIN